MFKVISVERIICSYRYLSWALTSLVYLLSKPYYVMHYKLGVIVSLFIFSVFTNNLLIKSENNKLAIVKLVVIETLGIELLLIPTGGLTSPFIWFALNPILISAIYLSPKFSWVNLFFYLVTGSIISCAIFNTESVSIFQIVYNNLNMILVFILINLAVQILSVLTNELRKSNEIKEELIEHIMSLYQMVETLNNHSNKEKIFEVFTKSTEKLTKSNLVLFWFKEDNSLKSSNQLKLDEQILIKDKLSNLKSYRECYTIDLINCKFIIIPILSTSTFYGVFAVQINEHEVEQNIKLLKFVSELCSIILERFEQEGVEEHLLLIEEQNRIANEMHDNVSQRLFSISYGIHGILGRLENLKNEEIKEYLTELYQSSDQAMKELRKTIYRLSSRKNGVKYLQNTIDNFINSIAKLQNISIKFNIYGDECNVPADIKRGLIRIIKEACGNAVKHSYCKNLNIELIIDEENIDLIIQDDGKGFELNKNNNYGLGLSNMNNIVKSFNGSIEIISEKDEGTNIRINVPIQSYFEKKVSLSI